MLTCPLGKVRGSAEKTYLNLQQLVSEKAEDEGYSNR